MISKESWALKNLGGPQRTDLTSRLAKHTETKNMGRLVNYLFHFCNSQVAPSVAQMRKNSYKTVCGPPETLFIKLLLLGGF